MQLLKSNSRKKTFGEFVDRSLMHSFSFIFCYLPNNIFVLIQINNEGNICSQYCGIFRIFVFTLSLTCLISVMIKLRDPYFKSFVYEFFQKICRKAAGKAYIIEDECSKDESCKDIENFNFISKHALSAQELSILKTNTHDFFNRKSNNKKKHAVMPDLNLDGHQDNEYINDKTVIELTNLQFEGKDNIVERSVSAIANKNDSEFNKDFNIKNNVYERVSRNETQDNEKNYFNKFNRSNTSNYNHNAYIRDIVNCFELLNQNVEITDYTLRIMGLTVFLDDPSIPTNLAHANETTRQSITEMFKSALPWDKDIYHEETQQKIYTKSNVPKNLKHFTESCSLRNIFISEINYKITIKEYAPRVFLHIRKIDKLQNFNLIESIDPINNLDHLSSLSDMAVEGGNSGNLLMFTHDKKFLIKTISNEEKLTFLDFLPIYHKRMRDYKTLLCRIYGLFSIQIQDKEPSIVIVMKNMSGLTSDVITPN